MKLGERYDETEVHVGVLSLAAQCETSIDLGIASGAISTGRDRYNNDLAYATSHRDSCQLQEDGRGVKVAYRVRSREKIRGVNEYMLQKSET